MKALTYPERQRSEHANEGSASRAGKSAARASQRFRREHAGGSSEAWAMEGQSVGVLRRLTATGEEGMPNRGPVDQGTSRSPPQVPSLFLTSELFPRRLQADLLSLFPLPSSSSQLKPSSPSIVHTSILLLAASKTSTNCEYPLAVPASHLRALCPAISSLAGSSELWRDETRLESSKSPNRRRPRQGFPVFALPSRTHQSTSFILPCTFCSQDNG